MLAAIHIGTYWTILGQKKFILPGYTLAPFNGSLERSLKLDVVLVFFKNYNTFKVVSVKTDRVKMYVYFTFLWFRCFVHEKGSISRQHPVLPIKKVLSQIVM